MLDVSNPDWVPQLNLGFTTSGAEVNEIKVARYKRSVQREVTKALIEEMELESAEVSSLEHLVVNIYFSTTELIVCK